MKKKKVIEKKETTVDDLFTHAIRDRGVENIPVPPPNRLLKPGDEVEVGNLENCVVKEVREDGRFVLVEYSSTNQNYGNPITTHGLLNVWPWMSVLRLDDMMAPVYVANSRFLNAFRSNQIESLLHMVYHRGLIDNPDYQRGYVWTLEDKRNYIESVFEARDLGKMVFLEDSSFKDYRVEILDGKQRLSAIMGYFESRFDYKGVYFHELSKYNRHMLESRVVQIALLNRNEMKKSDLLKLFLDINCAGVPQTEEHLDHVRKLYEEALKNDTLS